ncbi:hypothetical protein [Amycolatopsis sp. Hca4]|uniref:TRADD-N-associated membrane domain-containing protein n=1 Tax=Amycolatopsis sp. Hca4 TaxID=2742131 RepID=UPI0015901D84|nr:hypothetical protein [Amycolatopsis sp. Hca4]QKV79130.1 hypothetical protein HUT10_39150 [Amycolatopsis sp. Hca4]
MTNEVEAARPPAAPKAIESPGGNADPAANADATANAGRKDDSSGISHKGSPTSSPPAFSRLPTWLQVGIFTLVCITCLAAIFAFLTGRSSTSLILLATMLVAFLSSLIRRLVGSFDTDASQIRSRVNEESTAMHFHVEGEGATVNVASALGQDPATVRASDSLEKQEAILREIYTQGLAQAKISFRVSIVFASIGSLLLLLGIGLAIFYAGAGGDQYASIVAGTAGVVTNLTSGVFFVQSNRARANMGKQGVMMREESQEDRRLNAARELVGAISDITLRDQVRAALSRTLLNAPAEKTSKSRLNQNGAKNSNKTSPASEA